MQEPEQDYAGDPIQPVISVFIVALALTSHHGLGLGLGLGLAPTVAVLMSTIDD